MKEAAFITAAAAHSLHCLWLFLRLGLIVRAVAIFLLQLGPAVTASGWEGLYGPNIYVTP